ncbi:MAG: rhodanese-like domain-containing protein [Rickettsiales bacterium]
MPIQTIDAPTLKSWLDKGEAVLVDVREPAEYEAAHIAGALLMPLARVSKNTLPGAAGKKLVVHCKAGRRGGTACEKLLAEDPNLQIYNLEGGVDAWAQAGYAVQSSGKFFLPLDRQMQLTIGVGVLTGVILGYTLDSRFLLLSAVFGAGLMNAGITGWCGLAILMAKMPWNKGKSTCKTGACHG